MRCRESDHKFANLVEVKIYTERSCTAMRSTYTGRLEISPTLDTFNYIFNILNVKYILQR